MFLSAFVHLMMNCVIILLLAPILFEAALPVQLPFFLLALAIYIIVSLDGGRPINAPIETLITIMDCISVFLISGITEVKIPPIRRKKIRGTI